MTALLVENFKLILLAVLIGSIIGLSRARAADSLQGAPFNETHH